MKKYGFTMPVYTHQIDSAGHGNNAIYMQRMGRQMLFESIGLAVEDGIE